MPETKANERRARADREQRMREEIDRRGEQWDWLREWLATPPSQPWRQSSDSLPHAERRQENRRREQRDKRSERQRSQSGEPDMRRAEQES
jgi:hypothetical protein